MKKLAIIIGLIFTVFLGLKNVVAANTITSQDSGLVSNVLQFKAIPGDSHVTLSWSNPKNSTTTGVIVQRSTENYVATPTTGENIFKGASDSYVDLNLNNNQTYYYTIFTYDAAGIFSSGAIAKAMPGPPSLISPYQQAPKDYIDTNQKPQAAPKKIATIGLSDFRYYIVVDNKALEIGLNDLNNLRVTTDSGIVIEIPSDIFTKSLNVITVSTDDASYLMKLIPEKKKYQVVIPAPASKGDHELRFVAVFNDKSISDVKTDLIVDPRGYIYHLSSSFLGLGHKSEARIENAKVTIYQKVGDSWKVWVASEYFQQNPQTTNSSGEYSFFVPNGDYYLQVEKTGYKTVKTDPFTVSNLVMNQNIEMKLLIQPWMWLIAGLAVLAGVLLCIRSTRRRRARI